MVGSQQVAEEDWRKSGAHGLHGRSLRVGEAIARCEQLALHGRHTLIVLERGREGVRRGARRRA
jgi:hypothetical protein